MAELDSKTQLKIIMIEIERYGLMRLLEEGEKKRIRQDRRNNKRINVRSSTK